MPNTGHILLSLIIGGGHVGSIDERAEGLREVKALAQDPTADKWQSQALEVAPHHNCMFLYWFWFADFGPD